MKRLVLFVVALVFAFCTTVMAVDKPAVAPAKGEAVTAEKADAAKVEVKKAAKKAKKKVKKAAKKAEKKVEEEAPAAPAAK
jgi:ABC-type microcin C transport system permease subunit YejE